MKMRLAGAFLLVAGVAALASASAYAGNGNDNGNGRGNGNATGQAAAVGPPGQLKKDEAPQPGVAAESSAAQGAEAAILAKPFTSFHVRVYTPSTRRTKRNLG